MIKGKRLLAFWLSISLTAGLLAPSWSVSVTAATTPNNAEAIYVTGEDAFRPSDPAVFGEAKWIWDANDDGAGNRWMALRKDIALSASDLTGQVTARIAADTKYWLWINGKMAVYEGQLKRGAALLEKDVYGTPTSGQPNMAVMREEIATYYDEVDLAPFLQAGNNTIVALVWYFGNSGHSHVDSGQGAFLFHSQIGSVTVNSDDTWVTHQHLDYQPSANIGKATAGARQEYYIVYDAQKGFTGFEQPDFDVSNWTAAVELGAAGDKPWNELWARPIPEWKVRDLTAYTLEDDHITVQSTSSTQTVYRISLPTNIHFNPYLKVKAPAGLTIRFDVPNLAKDYQTYTTRGSENGEAVEQAWESPAWINWWYVDVTVPTGVEVLELGYRQSGYNAEQVGTFDSNNEFYDSVWQHAVDSAYVNMRDTVMDCPDRERCPWAGDACYTMYASLYFMDNAGHDLIRRMASTYVNWQSAAGVIPTTAPCTFAWNEWAELPSQSMRLMNFLWTYYEYTGDVALLEATYEPLQKYIAIFDLDSAEYTSPFLRGKGTNTVHENWIDWASYVDSDLFMNICAYNLVKTAMNYATVLEDAEGLARYAPLEEAMRCKFDQYFWTEKGYRSPNYKKTTLDERSNALAVVSGLVSPDKYPLIKDMLVAGNDASPGTITHVVEALGIMGYPDELMQRLYKSYKAEIENDRPTLGESWNSAKSTNHGWGSGSLAVLGGYIAGVRPLSAGYNEMLIAPMISNKLNTLNSTVSTAKGVVPVSVTRGDIYTLTTTVPADTRAKIGVERQAGDMAVYHGSTLLWNGKATDFAVEGLSFAGTDDRFVYFYANPGTWTLTAGQAVKSEADAFTLTLTAQEGGTLQVNGEPVALPYTGHFAAGTQVTVTASADENYAFSHFSGSNGGKTSTLTLTMDTDRAVTAHYKPIYSFNGQWLTLASNMDGALISVNGKKINLPYERLITTGSTVTLSAADTEDLTFLSWLDDEGNVVSSDKTLELVVDKACGYTAYYSSLTGNNLIAGKTMTASSSVENYQYGVKRATDGSVSGNYGYSTLSDRDGQTEFWVSFDLGANATISQFILYNRNGNNGYGIPTSMDIYSSPDGSTWTKVQSLTRENQPLGDAYLTVPLSSFNGRYIKIEATSLIGNPADGNQKRFQFCEIEVYGTATSENYALKAAVDYATNQSVSCQWCPFNLTDGRTASSTTRLGYTSAVNTTGDPEWVEVDLRTVKNINRVVLTPVYQTAIDNIGYGFPEDYTLEVSEDGKIWKTMKKVVGAERPTAGSVLVDFPATNARYVRLVATKLREIPGDANQKRLQLAEMEVYRVGDTAGPVITSNPEDVRTLIGETATFTVEATGTGLTYQWQSSTNGEHWTSIVGNGNTLNVIATVGNSFSRYRCVVTADTATTTSTSATLRAYSVEKISANLATYGTAAVSTGGEAMMLTDSVTDPAGATYQTADNPVSPWVSVTFDEDTTFSRVVLYAGEGGATTLPTAYTVEVSDGSSWRTVAVNTAYAPRTDRVLSIDFATVTAKAVQVTADRLYSDGSYNGCTRFGLAEVEVYQVDTEIVQSGMAQQGITSDNAYLIDPNRVNLAAGKSYFAYNPSTGVKDTVKTVPSDLTDGLIVNVNATTADTPAHNFITSFKWTYVNYTDPDDAADAFVVVDLGESQPVGHVLIGQGQDNHINGKIWRGYVYVGDTISSLFTDAYKVAEYHYETADAVPTAVNDLGVLMAAVKVRSGRYVGIRVPMNGSYYGASAIGFRTSEIGIYAPDASIQGGQLRDYDGNSSSQALRFGVTAQVSGAAYRTVGNNPYYADLSAATFTLSGTTYKVVELGTVVARKSTLDAAGVTAEEALTYAATLDDVKRVPAEKLYSIDGNTVTYTAVVTDIPKHCWGQTLVARSYVRFLLSGSEEDGTAVHAVYYGNTLERTVRQLIPAT